jgi:SAM-dependent methyltransferase
MRVTKRRSDVKDYWVNRWENTPADDSMRNPDVYPLKYAELVAKLGRGRILEAGCGAGRILRFFHEGGWDIVGMDFAENAVAKLREADPSLQVEVGDITALDYPDESFDYVMAFGLFHNLEHDRPEAVTEALRVLRPGGWLCASFRADSVHNLLIDTRASFRRLFSGGGGGGGPKVFHKVYLTRAECTALASSAGFDVREVHAAVNMPLWYRWRLLRSPAQRDFDEKQGRADGYALSSTGSAAQRILTRIAPDQSSNVFVVMATKPG